MKKHVRTIFTIVCIAVGTFVSETCAQTGEQGIYFPKKTYTPKPLPDFERTKEKLPSPVYEEDSTYVACYWKAWEIAFRNMYEPTAENGFVSQFIDAAFSKSIFLWDMCIISMFANYGAPYVPAIEALDNFYAKQHPDGEICRQMTRATGEDDPRWTNVEDKPLFSRYGMVYRSGIEMPIMYLDREIPKPNPVLTLEALNNPILAWAELESFRITGDKARLNMVFKPLEMYYRALQKYLRQGNGLYVTDWASMDNSPRNIYLMNGGTAIDISSQMVLFARNLAEIAGIIGEEDKAVMYTYEADNLSDIINEKMWHEKDRFYYDLTLTGQPVDIKTIGGFWPLVGQVCDPRKAELLAGQLLDESTFNRKHRVPSLAADEKGFKPDGGYMSGAIWPPTNTMIIRGLEKYGYNGLAEDIALEHVRHVVEVFKATGTIWENYAPDTIAKGRPAMADFVGWSGIGPVAYFIEYTIGIKANAPARQIDWTIRSSDAVGIRNFRFGGITADLVCNKEKNGKRSVEVSSDGDFTLKIRYGEKEYLQRVKAGKRVRLTV